MISGKVKRYGSNIINSVAPTSRIRSVLGDLKHAEATLRNLQHASTNIDTTSEEIKIHLRCSFQSLSRNVNSFENLKAAASQISRNHEENVENEMVVSSHRKFNAYSGRWNECNFSSEICKSLLCQTNEMLKANHVRQRVGIQQLDYSSTDDDPWTDLENWWNVPDLSALVKATDMDINNPIIAEAIKNALIKTRKLKIRAMATLVQNKEKTLTHDSRMNHTRSISQRLNPKIMDEPEAHHVILNPDNVHASSDIRCSNFQECPDNTLVYHQNWMNRSGSDWEHHWFQTSSKYGHINGIKFKFNGKPTDMDFQRVVKHHHEFSDTIRNAFKDAHSDEIAKVMQPPPFPNRAFDWMWHPSSDNNDWNSFVENYWKAITAIPGKARYNGHNWSLASPMD